MTDPSDTTPGTDLIILGGRKTMSIDARARHSQPTTRSVTTGGRVHRSPPRQHNEDRARHLAGRVTTRDGGASFGEVRS